MGGIIRPSMLLFQLTTSRRGRQQRDRRMRRLMENFNSRPHEEVDGAPRPQVLPLIISTHDLTKRSTILPGNITKKPEVFQLTTSRRGRPPFFKVVCIYEYFNSRPHEEVDAALLHPDLLENISTHDLTKRSTSRSRVLR